MADLNAFKNCSNFTDEETRSIALVRGVSAALLVVAFCLSCLWHLWLVQNPPNQENDCVELL